MSRNNTHNGTKYISPSLAVVDLRVVVLSSVHVWACGRGDGATSYDFRKRKPPLSHSSIGGRWEKYQCRLSLPLVYSRKESRGTVFSVGRLFEPRPHFLTSRGPRTQRPQNVFTGLYRTVTHPDKGPSVLKWENIMHPLYLLLIRSPRGSNVLGFLGNIRLVGRENKPPILYVLCFKWYNW